jgi:hypothetical protein
VKTAADDGYFGDVEMLVGKLLDGCLRRRVIAEDRDRGVFDDGGGGGGGCCCDGGISVAGEN